MESRIIALADAFEAMTGARSYRETMTPDEALVELARVSGTQFDPECVQALDDVLGGSPGAQPQASGDEPPIIVLRPEKKAS